MATWFIKQGVNEGYPALNGWPDEWQTGWTSNDDVRYPDAAWRIDGATNEGYPWIWYWFKTKQTDEGSMAIGGSQTNYPNGLTGHNKGGVKNQLDDKNMADTKMTAGVVWNKTVTTALSGKYYILTSTEFSELLKNMNNVDTSDEPDPDAVFKLADINLINLFYGANIYDGVLSCKFLSFNLLPLGQTPEGTEPVKLFGKYQCCNGHVPKNALIEIEMGTLDLDVRQAWEVEGIEYLLYLPFAGTFTLDIRNACTIDVRLFVDLINATGEYNIYIDGQLADKHRCILGCDLPVNFSQGQMQSNMFSNVCSILGQGLRVAGGVIGGAVGGPVGAIVGSGIGNVAGAAGSTMAQHYNTTAQALGGNNNFYDYPFVRLMCKIPKMFKDAYGYHELLGANRSTGYMKLMECSGFVKCKNYKTDLIVATEDEKREIERLLDEGVFV